MSEEMKQIIERTHLCLAFIRSNIMSILDNCSETELLLLNAETYAIYTTVFSECKNNVVRRNALDDALKLQTNPWTQIEH
jgi:hypothetical protein